MLALALTELIAECSSPIRTYSDAMRERWLVILIVFSIDLLVLIYIVSSRIFINQSKYNNKYLSNDWRYAASFV